jgi:hypothetical protein
MRKSDSISKIAVDLLKAQLQMGDAVKGSANPFFKSKFADLNSVREASIPVLNANNIGVFQPTVYLDGKAFVETILVHTSGEWLASETEIVYAKANDPQGQGSGISYARRYGLQSLLNIGAVDDDAEGAMGRTTPKANTYAPKASTVTPTPAVALVSTETLPVNAVQAEVVPAKKSSFHKDKPAQSTGSDTVWK